MKVGLRGMHKDIRVPYSFRLLKLAGKITNETPVGCEVADAWMVVLRPDGQGGVDEYGLYRGDNLQWKVWEADIRNGDIIHVIAPLPPHWHLREDARGMVCDSVSGGVQKLWCDSISAVTGDSELRR